jgi:hypothetical protein
MERWTMEATETGPWAAGERSRVGAAENLGVSSATGGLKDSTGHISL